MVKVKERPKTEKLFIHGGAVGCKVDNNIYIIMQGGCLVNYRFWGSRIYDKEVLGVLVRQVGVRVVKI